jgi:hypothetical protein
VEYFSLRNILTVGGVLLAISLWAAMMIAAADNLAADDPSKANGTSAGSKIKAVLKVCLTAWTIVFFSLLAVGSLMAAVQAAKAHAFFDFLGGFLRFLSFSIIAVLIIFQKKIWVQELSSGRSRLSKVIIGILSFGLFGSMILRVFAALAK